MGIRNSAKALIIDKIGSKILFNKSQNSIADMWDEYPDGMIYYDLPGGGQHQYETLKEAVRRECLEELGITVDVGRLAAIYEEIDMNEEFRKEYEEYAHKIFFVFICAVSGEPVRPATEQDFDMIGSEWIEIENINNIAIYPEIIKSNLDLILKTENTLYLGSKRVK
ncbi:MAG: NUDIX domain-containing protein [Oscillospiraceae bacterium]|nr:NUDIX domain-containing protein [Oscillospiraceae bacterium]